MAVIQLSSSEPAALKKAAAQVGKGGQVILTINPADDFEDVHSRLVLAGFINIKQTDDGKVTASFPDYQAGFRIDLKAKPQSDNIGWGVSLNADAPLLDENELLERDNIAPGTATSSAGCAPDATGKRKPCKDCSCGLADVYEDDSADQVERKTAPSDKSGCGSCSLGDAFRCASCPYLGLPPFKPGEKIALPTSLMTSDI